MGRYAVLGATGNVGSKIVNSLLQNSKNELNLYVRSEAKLFDAQPELQTNQQISIYEGDLEDIDLIKNCMSDTKAVFLAVALSENMPGCSIAFDTATIVVQALKRMQSEKPGSRLPRLVILSSSSVSEKFWKGVPNFVHNTIFCANCHIYVDLQKAEKYLREQEDWLTCTFVKPGGLSDDIPRGYLLKPENSHTFMSYADLANAMIEVADDTDGQWDMKDVGIVPKTTGASMEYKVVYVLTKGLVAGLFPNFYMYLRAWIP